MAYEKYQENRIELLNWIVTNDRVKEQAKQNFVDAVYALKLYNKVRTWSEGTKTFRPLQTKCSTKASWNDLRQSNGFGFGIGH